MTRDPEPAIPPLLWKYDLSPVTHRLRRRGVAHPEALEEEFRRVAALWYLHPREDVAPPKTVDEFWHEFILDTPRYRDFCQKVLGFFADHFIDDTQSGMKGPYESTKALYTVQFGAPPANLWTDAGANSMQRARSPLPLPPEWK